jgi:hypothetical protein
VTEFEADEGCRRRRSSFGTWKKVGKLSFCKSNQASSVLDWRELVFPGQAFGQGRQTKGKDPTNLLTIACLVELIDI